MVVYQDNKSNNIESPNQFFIQYSQDIPFDYSSGLYPSGKEISFVWEDNYLPVTHYTNGKQLGPHIWRRERIGLEGEWTAPQLISLKTDIKDIIKLEILNNLPTELPILVENGVIKHSTNYPHLPINGNNEDVLMRTNTGFQWIPQLQLKPDLTLYSTTSQLKNGLLDERYYTETEINNKLNLKSDIEHKHIDYITYNRNCICKYLEAEL